MLIQGSRPLQRQTQLQGRHADSTVQEVHPKGPLDGFSPTPKSTGVQSASAQDFPKSLDQEVIDLTRRLVRIDSSSANLVAGENAVVDVAVDYAVKAGLQVSRTTTVNNRPMLVVTLLGKKPELGAVGFVHHSDVVSIEGEWKTGEPFSGDIITDEKGRRPWWAAAP